MRYPFILKLSEVRQLIFALANKVAGSNTELVAQAVGNALYGCQMMTSDHEEVRYLLQVLSVKVNQCTELLEAQNVGNALYGLRGMGSDYKEGSLFLSLHAICFIFYNLLDNIYHLILHDQTTRTVPTTAHKISVSSRTKYISLFTLSSIYPPIYSSVYISMI